MNGKDVVSELLTKQQSAGPDTRIVCYGESISLVDAEGNVLESYNRLDKPEGGGITYG